MQEQAITDGRITVNGATVLPETVLCNNDLVLNHIHR